MSEIIMITGNVKHSITLEPSIWIFDDRKATLEDFFSDVEEASSGVKEDHSKDPYQERKRKRYKKDQWLTESFVMPAEIFIDNAGIQPDAEKVVFQTDDGHSHSVALEDVLTGAFAFSKDGKALTEDGPIHFYYSDGSNKENPIISIKKIAVE